MIAYIATALFLAAAFLAGATVVMLVGAAFSWHRERYALRGSYDATAVTDTGETIALEYKTVPMTDSNVIAAYRANTRPD